MKQVVIENPILNSPFIEPGRHYTFDDDGITDQVAEFRRRSSYFIPIAAPRKKGKQSTFDTLWTQDRARENDEINFIRSRVALWRGRGYPDVTPVTRSLLEYWRQPQRERRLFFCQIEALETLIYLTESAERSGDAVILNRLRDELTAAGTSLFRQASKMATGSGKTVVMGMIIAWHTLNKRRAPTDRRFADAFLIVTPGITIRDRLRVLLPSDPHNYYQAHDLVPAESLADLGTAKVVITNYHAFKARDLGDAGKLTKAVLARGAPSGMREVLNTVGKAGKLGEGVRCVVSVSMLTEGWDANSVTHILGVRAFGTQLLCEQVVGRGLRRMSYTLNEQGRFDPEYAEVYGVPFSFIPCAGSGEGKEKKPGTPKPGRVKALPERVALRPWLEITYPRLTGYRHELPHTRLEAAFTEASREVLTTADIPTRTENAPIVGESVIHTLDDLKKRREQEVAFGIAKLVLQQYFRAGDPAGEESSAPGSQVWLFPQVLAIARRWLTECVACKDDTFPQLLLLAEKAHKAAEKIHRAIAAASPGERRVRAVLQPYDTTGTTAGVTYDTTKPRWTTAADRCHINFVPCDSNWEMKFAQSLEEMDEVKAYVKNQNLGFKVPYTFEGRPGNYYPDYLLRVDDGSGMDDLLNLVVEISGQALADKEAKADTARKLWVPAVNAEGTYGRWAFLEITDPWDAQHTIRKFLTSERRGLSPS